MTDVHNEARLADYARREAELSALSDEKLKDRFWTLSDQVVAPIVDLARTHTSPSIERSVLLRMGIDSRISHGVVDRIAEAGLLGKGAGHVLVRLAARLGGGVDVRAAADALLADASVLDGLFATPTGTTTGGAR